MNELELDNPQNIIDKLSDNNKMFLDELISNEKIGKKILYIVFDFLDENVENLKSLDIWIDGEVTQVIELLKTSDIIKLIDLFVQLKQYRIDSTKLSDANFDKIISKLKRDVATLKKKLAQPSKLINTKQFEERYGFTRLQQKGLRGQKNPIPYSMMNQKTIMYEPEEVEKWLENYKGRMKSS